MSNAINSFIVVNPRKCTGCKACQVACLTAHNKEEHLDVVLQDDVSYVTMKCNHCEDAPCANRCPFGAIKQIKNRMVIDETLCVGCRACTKVCPFDAISIIPKAITEDDVPNKRAKNIAYKCDLCIDKDGCKCVEACPNNALTLVDPLQDMNTKAIRSAENLFRTVNLYK